VLALRRGGHFGIGALTAALPPGLRRGAAMLVHAALLGFLLLLTYLGAQAALRVREQLSTAMEISMTYGYASVPVGCGLMALEVARQLWRELGGTSR
jgi:TRAP-type C4-dicarboxylate transport system permease small subunit